MFGRTSVARVVLPRSVWEPIRKLRDLHGVELDTLAVAWNIHPNEMLKVLYAARMEGLDHGEELLCGDFLDRVLDSET